MRSVENGDVADLADAGRLAGALDLAHQLGTSGAVRGQSDLDQFVILEAAVDLGEDAGREASLAHLNQWFQVMGSAPKELALGS